jgi:hypothetical protein
VCERANQAAREVGFCTSAPATTVSLPGFVDDKEEEDEERF